MLQVRVLPGVLIPFLEGGKEDALMERTESVVDERGRPPTGRVGEAGAAAVQGGVILAEADAGAMGSIADSA